MRRSAEVLKNARKNEKKVKELQFQIEDEKKAVEIAVDNATKSEQKVKKLRVQFEESVSILRTSFKK